MSVHELQEYQLCLAAIDRLLRQVDLDQLSIKTEDFREGRIDHLIVSIPQQPDLDESFSTYVASWDQGFECAKIENINFIFIPLHDLLREKLEG